VLCDRCNDGDVAVEDGRATGRRGTRVLLLAGCVALVVGGAVAVLTVTRIDSEPSTQSPPSSLTSGDISGAVEQDSCPRPRHSVAAYPEWNDPDDAVFLSACAFDEAMSVPDNSLPIDVYASASGVEVIGWLYVACGLEGGYVEVGTPRPSRCAELSGVHVEDTVPDP